MQRTFRASLHLSPSISSSNLPQVGAEYPLEPPKITFMTKVFHPNVNFDTGEICLDILKRDWSPAWSLQVAPPSP